MASAAMGGRGDPDIPVDRLRMPQGDFSSLLISVTGPFFLGFALEYLAMGVILMLGIQYLVSLRHTDHRPTTGLEKQGRGGPTLVILSLFFNLLQTVLDLKRGWQMFAVDYLNIYAFATPNYIWFLSPFFGLFPALITQIFLLRRITLFLSSLSSLWPALDKPPIKMTFVIVMSAGIVISFIAGCVGSYYIWRSGPLWDNFVHELNPSRVADLIWLATSSGVDIVLSMVLSFELWWARRKLAARGGVLAKLVTFHGGLAVTALQLTALFLFEFKRSAAYCYLPILFLPKIYTLTLLLSLSLPQATQTGHSPSHVFSLPHIDTRPTSQAFERPDSGSGTLMHRRSSPSRAHTRTPVLPPLQLGSHLDKHEFKDKRKSNKSGMSSVVAKSWRLSQDWLTWSLLSTSTEEHGRDGKKRASGGGGAAKWKSVDHDEPMPPPPMTFGREQRRPSEPTSIAPLLPMAPTSDLSLHSVPTTSTYAQMYPHPHPHSYPSAAAQVASPPPSITVSRQHSFSTGRTSSSATAPFPAHTRPFESRVSPPPRAQVFSTTNSFSTFPRTRTLDPIRSVGTPEDEDDLGLEPPRRPGLRPRMMSFEDMLRGPSPDQNQGAK